MHPFLGNKYTLGPHSYFIFFSPPLAPTPVSYFELCIVRQQREHRVTKPELLSLRKSKMTTMSQFISEDKTKQHGKYRDGVLDCTDGTAAVYEHVFDTGCHASPGYHNKTKQGAPTTPTNRTLDPLRTAPHSWGQTT